MRIGSLFSGIGGLELGLERAGCGETVWQCEADPFARRVLAKHWPGVPIYEDVRSMGAWAPIPDVDIICGGFPCVDLSTANTAGRRGLDGEGSGLWREFLRVVAVVRPSFVVVENVGSVWRQWLPVVRRALWAQGLASVPLRVSSAEVGAPHHRDRVFVVAYSDLHREPGRALNAETSRVRETAGHAWAADTAPVGMAHGVSHRMDRMRCAGNAVVPQVAEVVGRVLMEAHSDRG